MEMSPFPIVPLVRPCFRFGRVGCENRLVEKNSVFTVNMEATDDRLEGLKDLLGQAIVLKTDGNAAYSSKDYQTAIRKYHRAIMLLKAVVQTKTVESELLGTQDGKELPKEMVDQRDQLISECYNNLAACLLTKKDPNYQRIVEHCEKVLDHDPSNVKAAFRMGTALYHLGNLERAKATITSKPSFQSEKAIQTLLRSIMEKEKVADEKLKSTYQRMFMSDPAGGRSHSDPIVIKNNAPDNGHKANGAESSPSNQGTKFIQVASANNEAPC